VISCLTGRLRPVGRVPRGDAPVPGPSPEPQSPVSCPRGAGGDRAHMHAVGSGPRVTIVEVERPLMRMTSTAESAAVGSVPTRPCQSFRPEVDLG
jgi:hypothetical protein